MARTALIIDNDQGTVSQVSEALSPLGYSVSGASDAESGLSQAKGIIPSIMLVNLATPGSNGLELCKTIHASDELKDVPIILLTLREGKFDPVYVKLYGIVAFLKKPFDDGTLLGLVKEHSTATDEPAAMMEEAVSFEEPEAAEETAMAEETFAAAEEFAAAADEDAFEGADATMTMSVGGIDEDEGVEIEAEGADEEFGQTITLEGAEDLSDLQASFDAGGGYDEDAGESGDEGFEIGTPMEMDEEAPEAEGQSDWGPIGTPLGMEDEASAEVAEETWDMGTDMSMHEMDSAAVEGFEGGGGGMAFEDTGGAAGEESFDAGGTMAFDAGAGGGGFDSEGTMSFDSTADTGEGFSAGGGFDEPGETTDLDIGGFKASKSDEGAGAQMASAEDEQGAWGDGGVDSVVESDEDLSAAFEEEEEAFSAGFEEDDEGFGETMDGFAADDADVGFGEGFGDADEGFAADAGDSFGETQDPFAEAGGVDDEGFGAGEDAGFDDTFLEEGETAGQDFAGDDQDYTGLFEPVAVEGEDKKDKKKKKKKGFKSGRPSKLLKVLLVLLLIGSIGGGGYYYRDMLPLDKLSLDSLPFIGKKDTRTEAKKEPAKQVPKPAPVPAEPAPASTPPESAKPEPAKPVTEAKKPAAKEPVAPKEEVKQAPKKAAEPVKKPMAEPVKKQASKASVAQFKKGPYYVQFGVFSKQRNADRLSGQLKKKGYGTVQTTITDKKGQMLQVVLLDTPFNDRASAESKGKQITKATGFDTAVFK